MDNFDKTFDKTLELFQALLIILGFGTYFYVLTKLALYTLEGVDSFLTIALVIGIEAALLALVFFVLVFFLEPAIYLLGTLFIFVTFLFKGILTLIRRFRRSRT